VPFEASVSRHSLPFPVRHYGKTIFRVEEFLADGLVIGEQSPGLRIEGQLFYTDLSGILGPAKAEEPSPPQL
jgi:hypothetical protein